MTDIIITMILKDKEITEVQSFEELDFLISK